MHLLMHLVVPLAFTPVGHVDHPRLVQSGAVLIGTPRFPIVVAPGNGRENDAKSEGSPLMIRYMHRAPASSIQFECTLTTLSAPVHFIIDSWTRRASDAHSTSLLPPKLSLARIVIAPFLSSPRLSLPHADAVRRLHRVDRERCGKISHM